MEGNIEFIDNKNENSGGSNNKRKIILIFVVTVFILIVFLLVFLFYSRGGEKNVSSNKNLTDTSSKSELSKTELEKQKALEVESKKIEPKWDIKEEVLYTIPIDQEWQKGSMTFSSDGKSFAYVGYRHDKKPVFSVIDGKEGIYGNNADNYFKNTSNPANAEKIVYTKQAAKYVLMYKGKKFAENDDVITGYISLNDKKQFIYYVEKKNGIRVPFVNNISGSEYQIVGSPSCNNNDGSCDGFAFAYDGRQNAYVAKKGAGYVVVINEKEREEYSKIDSLMFSLDNSHFAYKAFDGSKSFLVIDGEEQGKYDYIFNIKFNKDGSLTYNVLLEKKILFVIESLKLPSMPEVSVVQDQQIISDQKYTVEDTGVLEQQKYDVLNWMSSASASVHDCLGEKEEVLSGIGGAKICNLPSHTWPIIKICGDNLSDTKWIVANGKSLNWNITLNCNGYAYCNGQANAICNDSGCTFNKGCDPNKK